MGNVMLPQHLKERDIATLYVNKNGQLVVMPKKFLIIVKHTHTHSLLRLTS